MQRHVFHLAFPVSSLATSLRFYAGQLGARVGRQRERWADILLWGHQITLHERPDELDPDADQGKRHFGVILPWSEWEELVARLDQEGAPRARGPVISSSGTPQEQAKFYLHDPDGYVIEIKAYRDVAAALEIDPDSAA